jgi:hypothetical protein
MKTVKDVCAMFFDQYEIKLDKVMKSLCSTEQEQNNWKGVG